MEPIKNRYDFVMLFDVENGNPNGDPDADNMPRTDPETSIGIVTDVCLKRKIRNYIDLSMQGKEGYNILIKPDKELNLKFTDVYKTLGLTLNKKGANLDEAKVAQDYMCANYYDVRTFGAVMSTGKDWCGKVTGPVQITFAKSIDCVYPQEITITRQARTQEGKNESGSTEMGKKAFVPYGLYRAEGYVSAMLAQRVTGFSEDDLSLLWKAIVNMFEHDRSAARGKMVMRKLVVFKHDSAIGNAPSHILLDKVKVVKKPDVDIPRKYSDYEVTVDESLPSGVEIVNTCDE